MPSTLCALGSCGLWLGVLCPSKELCQEGSSSFLCLPISALCSLGCPELGIPQLGSGLSFHFQFPGAAPGHTLGLLTALGSDCELEIIPLCFSSCHPRCGVLFPGVNGSGACCLPWLKIHLNFSSLKGTSELLEICSIQGSSESCGCFLWGLSRWKLPCHHIHRVHLGTVPILCLWEEQGRCPM